MKPWQRQVLQGWRGGGAPLQGPTSVHLDVTNRCNAACVTCWDHSPLLASPRPEAWKARRVSLAAFDDTVTQLAAMGSVRHVILSGMGEPLTHPDIYAMIARVKAEGWEVTLISNLVAADPDRLVASGVDQVLAGVQGATPDAYAAFHPGWSEGQFFELCRVLRVLARGGVKVRHVQVIAKPTVREVVDMVRFGRTFGADRVNFKLASLGGGNEPVGIDEADREWLLAEGLPAARTLASSLGVPTNLDLFEVQVRAGGRATAPIAEIGCAMGYVFTRITVDRDVLYCCNTHIRVGSLLEERFDALWTGPAWQALRERIRGGDFPTACDQCGKIEQNLRWKRRLDAWDGR